MYVVQEINPMRKTRKKLTARRIYNKIPQNQFGVNQYGTLFRYTET